MSFISFYYVSLDSRQLLDRRATMILTDDILAESATLIRRRLGYDASERFLHSLEESETIGTFRVVCVDVTLLDSAKAIFSEMADTKLSFVDVLSFATMRKMGIRYYFAFDIHFVQAGFEPS